MNPLAPRWGSGSRRWALVWGLAAVVLVTLAVLAPSRAVVLLGVAEAGAALAAVLVLHRRGVLLHRIGLSVVTLLVLLACSSAVLALAGPGAPLATALVAGGQVVVLVGCVPLFIAHADPAASPRRARVLGAEVAIVAVGTSLAVLQAFVHGRALGVGLSATTTSAIDLVSLTVFAWLLLTRRRLLPFVALGIVAGGLLMVQNYLATSQGIPLGGAEEFGQPIGVLGALLLGAATTHPSLVTLVAGRYRPLLRSGAARLTVVVPFACIPVAAWASGVLDPASRLPAGLIIAAAVAISLLALTTAFGLVGDTERAAETDPLSGLPGRLGVMRRLDELHAAGAPTAVVLVDIDDFTDVNQRHGQEVGDAVLVAILQRAAAHVPPGAVVSRLSGDELLLLLPESVLDARWLADPGERVREVFAEPFTVADVVMTMSASVGVAGLLDRPDGLSRDALADADVAQRLAKTRGGDRCVTYDETVRAEVMEPVHLMRDLRIMLGPVTGSPPGAVGMDEVGHLVVFYQPIIDVASGAPVYVEALVRWLHPQRGMVFPDTFLPLAEIGGVAAALDRAVMTQALRQLAEWDAAGLGVQRVSVNLGGASMREGGLWTFAVTACRDAGVGLDRLVLEITEHDALDVDGGVVEDLLALRDAGVQVALDDFGAGHASVGYLRRWPASVVKLDRSLLPSVSPPAHHEAMLDAHLLLVSVADLVHALGLRLLVEGVEDARDEALVASLGAQNAQGYHFSRPVPAGELARWWRAQPAPASPSVVVAARAAGERVT